MMMGERLLLEHRSSIQSYLHASNAVRWKICSWKPWAMVKEILLWSLDPRDRARIWWVRRPCSFHCSLYSVREYTHILLLLFLYWLLRVGFGSCNGEASESFHSDIHCCLFEWWVTAQMLFPLGIQHLHGPQLAASLTKQISSLHCTSASQLLLLASKSGCFKQGWIRHFHCFFNVSSTFCICCITAVV